MMRRLWAAALLLAALVLVGVGLARPAAAQPFSATTLYQFCPDRAGGSCSDGAFPGGLTMDGQGNLFGTGGGGIQLPCPPSGCGVLFELTPSGQETVLYSFCASDGCLDGSMPDAGIVINAAGNVFGATFGGGAGNRGTVFEVTPSGSERVIYSFCTAENCTDGADPASGVILDSQGNLYGTTLSGGANGAGTVFEVTPSGTERVLHSFCSLANCVDGSTPQGGVIIDAKGNLFGTTLKGGVNGAGTVFKLSRNGHEKVLYDFCVAANCADGANPSAVVLGKSNTVYGVTYNGGAQNDGVVFKLTGHKQTVLYSFCAAAGCTDGSSPAPGLTMDASGNLFGATSTGGANGGGAVFEVTPDGQESVLFSFCACIGPFAGVITDPHGNLFGTTLGGGATNAGTIFELLHQ